MTTDSRVLLTAYTNYMRGLRGGQGNSLQRQSWGDYNDDGIVNIVDVSNAAFFFGATNSYWTHPQYSCTPTTTTEDVCDLAQLVVYFDEGVTTPFGGTGVNPSTQLNVLDPQIDPYSMPLASSGVCLYYQNTGTSSTRLLLVNCGTSTLASLPAGHTISDSANVLNSDGTLGPTQAGSISVSGGTVTNSWAPSLVSGTHYEIRFFDNSVQIGQFYATP
jgi:hypothetical protein